MSSFGSIWIDLYQFAKCQIIAIDLNFTHITNISVAHIYMYMYIFHTYGVLLVLFMRTEISSLPYLRSTSIYRVYI